MKTSIEALRKMTVANGCTEEEAATAALKLAWIELGRAKERKS
jgi:hypothetical protein